MTAILPLAPCRSACRNSREMRPEVAFSAAEVYAQAAEAERDLHVRAPVPVVLDVERLDPWHRLRHPRRIVEDLPDGGERSIEHALTGDLHRLSTVTSLRVSPGLCSSSHTR